jgi:hypothetical protein
MSAVSIPSLIIAIYNAWQPGHFSHLIYPAKPTPTDLKVQIGNDQCSQPYHALIFNIHSTEHSDLANTFIDPVKSKEHDYSQFSVAEGLETYRLATGCLVLQIRPGYQEYQTENGHFNSTALKKIAQRAEVKMIELTANPTFRNAEGMIHFLNNLREISGGKPIGIRLCIDDKKKFYQICHAARKTQLIPDFIVVEGCTKNINHPQDAIQSRILLYDALQFVSQTLQLYGLQNRIKVIADGKITSGVQILKALALGANAVCMEMPRYTAIGYAVGSRKV